jgi:hypothetical protein
MKKLILLFCAIFALSAVVPAHGAAHVTKTADASTDTNVVTSDDDEDLVTVGGTIYYHRNDGTMVAIYDVEITLQSDDTFKSPTKIKTNTNGHYDFTCKRNEQVTLTLGSVAYNHVQFAVPMDSYTIVATGQEYNIQVVGANEEGVMPHVKVKFTVTLGNKVVPDLPVQISTRIENAEVRTYSGTTDENGVCVIGDNVDLENRPIANIYYDVLIDVDDYVNRECIDYVEYADEVFPIVYTLDPFNCTVNCNVPKTGTSSGSEAQASPTVRLYFYDEDDNDMKTNVPYATAATHVIGTQSTATMSLYSSDLEQKNLYLSRYKVRGSFEGYYQSAGTTAADYDGVKWSEVPDANTVVVNMQRFNHSITLTEPLVSDTISNHYFNLAFSGHKLTHQKTGSHIVLHRIGSSSQAQVRRTDTATTDSNTATTDSYGDDTVWSSDLIPMYAVQDGDNIRIYKDMELAWQIPMYDNSSYELVIPKDNVEIDSYLYDWPLTSQIDISTGVFGVQAEDDGLVDIYTASGVLVKHSVEESSIHDLPSGLYIVRGTTRAYKYLQR